MKVLYRTGNQTLVDGNNSEKEAHGLLGGRSISQCLNSRVVQGAMFGGMALAAAAALYSSGHGGKLPECPPCLPPSKCVQINEVSNPLTDNANGTTTLNKTSPSDLMKYVEQYVPLPKTPEQATMVAVSLVLMRCSKKINNVALIGVLGTLAYHIYNSPPNVKIDRFWQIPPISNLTEWAGSLR